MFQVRAPSLSAVEKAQLIESMNFAFAGHDVRVSLLYDKQTETKPRIDGVDYQGLLGVSAKSHIGRLTVHQYVDNPANRRKGRVGVVYLKVATETRGDGASRIGFANLRPEGITGFRRTYVSPEPVEPTQ